MGGNCVIIRSVKGIVAAGTGVSFPNYSPIIPDVVEAVWVLVKGGSDRRRDGNDFSLYWQRLIACSRSRFSPSAQICTALLNTGDTLNLMNSELKPVVCIFYYYMWRINYMFRDYRLIFFVTGYLTILLFQIMVLHIWPLSCSYIKFSMCYSTIYDANIYWRVRYY